MTDAASSDSNNQQPNNTQTSTAAPAVKEAVGRSVDGHRVLLVDDQPMIGEAVRRLLADQADMTFAFCKDASKAVTTAEEFQPTVILQDLVMPDIDGLDLVGKFRSHAGTEKPLDQHHHAKRITSTCKPIISDTESKDYRKIRP